MNTEPKPVYTIEDLRQWREVTSALEHPARLAVFGWPVAHSRSPQMHEAALKACGISMHYVRLEIAPDDLAEALQLCAKSDFLGVNLTVPHKTAALALIDDVDPHATRLGAVNTVLFENGKSSGFNTDGPGFVQAVRLGFGLDVRDLRVLVLGAGGGAGRGIATQCALEKSRRLVLTNRTIEKAEALSQDLLDCLHEAKVPGPMDRLLVVPFTPEALRAQMGNLDLVVNCTTIGMKRTDPSVLPREILAPHLVVLDTVYAAGRTKLMQAAEEAGARALGGLSMLLHQGALSFEIWFDRTAPLDAMEAALTR